MTVWLGTIHETCHSKKRCNNRECQPAHDDRIKEIKFLSKIESYFVKFAKKAYERKTNSVILRMKFDVFKSQLLF